MAQAAVGYKNIKFSLFKKDKLSIRFLISVRRRKPFVFHFYFDSSAKKLNSRKVEEMKGKCFSFFFLSPFSRVLRDSTTRFVRLSVRPSVGWLVGRSHFTFFMIFILWPRCSCPNGLVTSIMAPAHPHATKVAVYQALFFLCFDSATNNTWRDCRCDYVQGIRWVSKIIQV